MTQPSLAELRSVWTSRPGEVDEATGLRRAVLGILADGEPVSAADIAAAAGLTLEEGERRLRDWQTAGYEFDEHGRLVGAALTLRPTPHRFEVRGNQLYAWCGFDTLFLPILLGEPARVRSTCPVTGAPVVLTVAADGTVASAQPPGAVVAVVGPQVTSCCTTTGPASPVCTQMPLFASRVAAES